MEWPGRCCVCNEAIADWNDAGFQGRRWIHKMIFLLMFHFGLGAAVIGWIMMTQGDGGPTATFLLVSGLLIPLVGVVGVALNIVSRRRIELIRRSLELQGGWKPGR
jgi:hypothetical protein